MTEHAEHLNAIFRLFNRLRISLKGTKSFLGYPSTTLLDQKVDGFGLSTSGEKLLAISKIVFTRNLKDLETYLGLTGWLRNYVPYYAQISEPLQKTKTQALKRSPKGGNARKSFTKSMDIVPTSLEMDAFTELQARLTRLTYLTHFDHKRRVYIDLDASKRHGFGVMVYHVKGDPTSSDLPGNDIQPILFVSKLLNIAEANYWPTELEVAGLVCTIKKVSGIWSKRSI